MICLDSTVELTGRIKTMFRTLRAPCLLDHNPLRLERQLDFKRFDPRHVEQQHDVEWIEQLHQQLERKQLQHQPIA